MSTSPSSITPRQSPPADVGGAGSAPTDVFNSTAGASGSADTFQQSLFKAILDAIAKFRADLTGEKQAGSGGNGTAAAGGTGGGTTAAGGAGGGAAAIAVVGSSASPSAELEGSDQTGEDNAPIDVAQGGADRSEDARRSIQVPTTTLLP